MREGRTRTDEQARLAKKVMGWAKVVAVLLTALGAASPGCAAWIDAARHAKELTVERKTVDQVVSALQANLDVNRAQGERNEAAIKALRDDLRVLTASVLHVVQNGSTRAGGGSGVREIERTLSGLKNEPERKAPPMPAPPPLKTPKQIRKMIQIEQSKGAE